MNYFNNHYFQSPVLVKALEESGLDQIIDHEGTHIFLIKYCFPLM